MFYLKTLEKSDQKLDKFSKSSCSFKDEKQTYFDDNTAWIVSVFGVFLVGIFTNSVRIWSVFSPNAGKYGPEKSWI